MAGKDKHTPTQRQPPRKEESAVEDFTRDVEVTVAFELGRTNCTLDQLLQVGDSSLFELERAVGEPIDILLNGRVRARGEVVTVDENFGVRVTEIVRDGAV